MKCYWAEKRTTANVVINLLKERTVYAEVAQEGFITLVTLENG